VRRRLLVSTGLIALTAVVLLGVPLGIVGARLLREAATGRLEREADTAAARVAALHASGAAIDTAALARIATPGHRLEVRLPDGRVVSGGSPPRGGVVRVRAGSVPPGGLPVTIVASGDERDEEVGGVWLAVIVLSTVAVAAALGLASLQARRMAVPLERVAARARRLGRQGSPGPSARTGVPEIDAVDRALTAADDRIDALLRHEREFSANVSHQLRTPLTGLRLQLEDLRENIDDAVGRHALGIAIERAERLGETIAELERLARSGDTARDTSDLAEVVRTHGATWRAAHEVAGRGLELDAEGTATVTLGAEVLRQVLDVLLDNAARHGAGRISVVVDRDDGWARLTVSDDGAGVPRGEEARVFDRGRSFAGGSGVGLALARDLVRRGGGELSLAHARPPRFEVRLPMVR
jgi:signal transduction histidine kinase